MLTLAGGGSESTPTWARSMIKGRRPSLLVAFLVLSAACGSGGEGPPSEPAAGPSFKLAPLTLDDTIEANYPSPLVVTVRDATGAPAKGDSVTLSATFLDGQISPLLAAVFFSRTPDGFTSAQLKAPTDPSGTVSVWIHNATTSGAIRIRARSGFGKDSLDGVVRPGKAHHFAMVPADTALYIGARITPAIAPRDRFNNNTPATVSLTARRPAVLDVLSGALAAVSTGRAYVLVAAEGARDSIAVSVVPAGTLIANKFINSSGDVGTLVTFGLDGSEYHSVAPGAGGGMRWSTALGRLVFQAAYPPPNLGREGLYSMQLDGMMQLLLSPLSVSDGTTTGNEYASIYWPSVSSDGGAIYFAGTTTYNSTSIWRMRPDGTGVVRVGPQAGSTNDSQPTVSPDGKLLAYITDAGNLGSGGTHLMRLDLTTGVSLSLVALGFHPLWSPKGDEIAYFANGVSVIRPDGTGETVVIASDRFDRDGQIDWSPDGKWLVACMTGDVSGARQIVVINRATGELLPLAFTRRDNLCEATWKN